MLSILLVIGVYTFSKQVLAFFLEEHQQYYSYMHGFDIHHESAIYKLWGFASSLSGQNQFEGCSGYTGSLSPSNNSSIAPVP